MKNHKIFSASMSMSHFFFKKSFTLIELLFVISIISLLAAMLLPALRMARDNAKSAVCMNNLKQLGEAATLYSGDNNDVVLPYSTVPWPPPPTSSSWHWSYLLNPYAPVPGWGNTAGTSPNWWQNITGGIYQCPMVPSYEPVYASGGYGVDVLHTSPYASTLKLGSLTRPSQLFLLGDDHTPGKGADNAMWCPLDSPWWNPTPSQVLPTLSAAPRHGNGKRSNICFIDGHVESWAWMDLSTNKNDVFGHFSQ